MQPLDLVPTNTALAEEFRQQHALPQELVMPHTISEGGDGPMSGLLNRMRAATDPNELSLLLFQWNTLKFAGGYTPELPQSPVVALQALVGKPTPSPAVEPVAPPSAANPEPAISPCVAAPDPAGASADFDLHSIINLQVAEQSYAQITSLQSPPQTTPNIDGLRTSFLKHNYFISEPNLLAVDCSIQTGTPIIVEGPPGTGKSTLAEQIAIAIGLDPKNPDHLVELFCTSDISKSSVLYEWSDSRRLMDLQTLQSLAGRLPMAKLMELYHDLSKEAFSLRYLTIHRLLKAVLLNYRCVCLIDEIDKTYPEFDTLLFDILEKSSFVIPEIGRIGKPKEPLMRPIFVITSNALRELSSPLKRRANYAYFQFLNEVTEAEVLVTKTGISRADAQRVAMFFRELREHRTFRPSHLPSTAEALTTVRTLLQGGVPLTRANLLRYHGVWLKGRHDFQSFYRIFADEIQAAVQPTLTAVAA